MSAQDSAEVAFGRAVGRLFTDLQQQAESRAAAAEQTYQALTERGWLPRVTLHRYMCQRGCQIATVFRAGSSTLCAVRDYKLSPGMNASASVASARAKNTLDGDRWWPSHVYDVDEIAEWGPGTGIQLSCRHYRGVLEGQAVLADIEGVIPGHSGKPTRL